MRHRMVRAHEIAAVVERVLRPEETGATPCSLCSRLRRGVLYGLAGELGATKIALGHHLDDLAETLMMNLFFTGSLRTMPPKLVSDDGKNVVIRPMAYVEERDLTAYAAERRYPTVRCSCPTCGLPDQQRQVVKRMLTTARGRASGPEDADAGGDEERQARPSPRPRAVEEAGMKFVCDKCNTRYSIADERVHGRVLKIRCKACNNVITVREEHAPAPASLPPVASSLEDALASYQQRDDEQTRVSSQMPMPPAAEAAPSGSAEDWYVSFDGDQEGPLPLARALDRVRAERPRGKECFCWRGGFFVWLPVEDVPEFAPALVKLPPPIPAVRPRPGSTTGAQAAVKSPTGKQPALKSPTGSNPAVRSTGSHPVVKSPTGPMQALRGASGNMNAVPPPGDLLSMDSGPLGAPARAAAVARDEARAAPDAQGRGGADAAADADAGARSVAAAVAVVVPDSGPAVLSPFRAALQVSGPTMVAGGAPNHVPAPSNLMTMDSGPVPLPPPPGNHDLPIDEPSGLVNLSHVSKPAMPAATNQAKQVVETFGGVAVTPSKPTPPPQPIVIVPGRAGGPGWIKWAAVGGAAATVALLVVVIVLMQRKPTVIVVPPAPTLGDAGKKLTDKPITVEDPGAPASGVAATGQRHVGGRRQARAKASAVLGARRHDAEAAGGESLEHAAQPGVALSRRRQRLGRRARRRQGAAVGGRCQARQRAGLAAGHHVGGDAEPPLAEPLLRPRAQARLVAEVGARGDARAHRHLGQRHRRERPRSAVRQLRDRPVHRADDQALALPGRRLRVRDRVPDHPASELTL